MRDPSSLPISMQAILLVFNGLGRILDLMWFLLDLNYCLVSSLVSILFGTVYFILNLPGLITLGLLRCWESVVISWSMMGEMFTNLAVDCLHALGDGVRGLWSGLDSFQLLWNLICHMVMRSKELIQRGLLNIALSGQNSYRQVCEVLGIAGGLLAYFLNSLVNAVLIGVQNSFSAAVGLWLTLVNVLLLGQELATGFLSLIAIILWAPFKFAMESLTSCTTGMTLYFYRNIYQLLILLFCLWISHMVYRILNFEVWRSVATFFRQLYRICQVLQGPDQNVVRTGAPIRVLRMQNPAGSRVHNPPPAWVHAPAEPAVPNRPPVQRGAPPPVHLPYASTSRESLRATVNPWELLKQHEESKKCVICQDEAKTIVLLPCRHLCLCAQCIEILLQQPIQNRNCPLCRRMIVQTLNVYM